jgi:hypothetical protein
MTRFLQHMMLAALIVAAAAVGDCARAQSPERTDLDRATEFVGWVEPETLYWRPFAIEGLPDAEFKLLSLDVKTGARAQITRFPPGWRQPVGYYNTNNELFVLSGDLTIGDDRMTKYSYAYYPAGLVVGEARSESGATVLHWMDAPPAFTVSKTSKDESRRNELVTHWNFYDTPWTTNENFPKWADFPPSPEMRLKLLRQDKKTGQMTWINFGAAGGGGLAKGKSWEAHPMWEEAMVLEGDLTYGECLPGGERVGTYRPGGYFFRPPNIRHGGASARSSGYSLFIFRSAASLWTRFFDTCDTGPAPKAKNTKE